MKYIVTTDKLIWPEGAEFEYKKLPYHEVEYWWSEGNTYCDKPLPEEDIKKLLAAGWIKEVKEGIKEKTESKSIHIFKWCFLILLALSTSFSLAENHFVEALIFYLILMFFAAIVNWEFIAENQFKASKK